MVLKQLVQLLKTPLFGLEEDEITWFSNSKRFSECCTVGLADVKLHGFKPDFSMCRWISGLERCEIAGYSNCIWYWKML